jgi:hypothetical protein
MVGYRSRLGRVFAAHLLSAFSEFCARKEQHFDYRAKNVPLPVQP